MNISYSVESWVKCRPELEAFVPLHHAELGLDHADVPVDMAWDVYAEHEAAGRLHFVSVRDNGVLIGYVSAIIAPMLHYKSTKHAIIDLYYLLPDYRKAKIGVQMLQFAERCYKELGVVKLISATKLHLNHEKLFLSLGMKPTEVTYTKILRSKNEN